MGNETWSDQSGDWSTATLWNPGTVPTAADTAVFDSGDAYLVTIGTSTTAPEAEIAASVSLDDVAATLRITQGSRLATAGTFDLLAGTLALDGILAAGVLFGQGGSLEIGGDTYAGSGTLSGETIAGTVLAGGYYGVLDIARGLAFQPGGTLALVGGQNDDIAVLQAETLDGGTILLGESGATLAAVAGAVTFGAGFTLDVAGLTERYLPADTLAGSIVNDGTIAIAGLGALVIAGDDPVNAGKIVTTGTDASVTFASGTLTNTGVIAIGAGDTLGLGTAGGALALAGAGDLTVASGGTLVLGSTETTAQLEALLGSIAPAGVTVVLEGTLLNDGATLTIGAVGSLADVVLDGDVVGGAIANDGGSLAIAGGTFDGVTVDGPLDFDRSFVDLDVQDGLTVQAGPAGGAGTIEVTGSYDTLAILDGTTLADVTVNVAAGAGQFVIDAEAPTLALGAGVTITAAAGLELEAGATIVSAADIATSPGPLFLPGYIAFDADTIVNTGTLQIAAGTGLALDPDGPLQPGATLDVVGGEGISLASGASLAVGGAETTAQLTSLVDGISHAGVTLTLDGSITNTGATLLLAPGAFGATTLNAAIAGGTVIDAGGLAGLGEHPALQGVTFDGPLVLAANYSYLTVSGGLTLLNTLGTAPGTLTLSGRDVGVDITDTETLDNLGIDVGGQAARLEHGTLTLGAGVSLTVTGALTDGGAYGGAALTNDGTITDDGSLLLDDQTVINAGVIAVGSYDVLGIALAGSGGASLPFTNTGTGSVTFAAGATFEIGGTETDAQLDLLLGSLSNPGVVVGLDGTLLNTGSVFSSTAGGLLNDVLLDATIVGGVVTNGTGSLAVRGGTFDGVTYDGTLTLNGGLLGIVNGISLTTSAGPGAVVLGSSAGLDFEDSSDVFENAALTVTGVFDDILFNALTLAPSLTMTVDGDLTLLGTSVTSDTDITVGGMATLTVDAALINDAVITVGAGDVLDLGERSLSEPLTVVGAGSIAFAAGSTLELDGVETPGQLITLLGSVVGAQPDVAVVLGGEILATGTSLVLGTAGPLSNVALYADVVGGTIVDTTGPLSVMGGALNGVVVQAPTLVLGGFETEIEVANGLTILNPDGAAGTLDMTGTNDQLILLDNAPTLDHLTFLGSGLNDQFDQLSDGVVTLGPDFQGDVTGYALVEAGEIVTAATIDVAVGAVFQLAANTIFNSGTIYVGDTAGGNTSGIETRLAGAASSGGVDKTVFGTAIGLALLGIGDDDEDPFGSYGAAQKLLNFIYGDPDNVVFGANSGLAIGSILQTSQLPAIFADFSTRPDLVILDGSIDNTGATLDVTPTGTLSNVLIEAIVSNGEILDQGSLQFALQTTLTGVTFVGEMDLSTNSDTEILLSDTTVINPDGSAGTIDVSGTQDTLLLTGGSTAQTLDNVLVQLAMAQGATADALGVLGGGIEVLGAGVTIAVGGTASINVYYGYGGSATLTNAGVIADNGALTLGGDGETRASFFNSGLIAVGPATFPAGGTGPALTILGGAVNTGTIAVTGPETVVIDSTSFYNSGIILLAGGATLDVQAAPGDAGAITMADGHETLEYDDAAPFAATVSLFNVDDVIDLTAVPFAGTLAVSDTLVGNVLDVFEGATLAAAITLPSFPYTQADFVLGEDAIGGTEILTNAPPCFLAGTRIRTSTGEIAVEDLSAGMRIVTRSGVMRPVVWIGQRHVDCRRHPTPDLVQPVRVRADAFGPGSPVRDLLLSPDHSLFLDGVLIPVRHLLNGATVTREHVASAHYFHVELSAHDVLLAENLPVESYLDTGNRCAFANGGTPVGLHPDFSAKSWEGACAPLCESGARLAAVRARLRRLARKAGYRPGAPATPVLRAGGRTIHPCAVVGALHRFLLPENIGQVTILSAIGVPAAAPDAADCRTLGVAIAGIVVHGRAIDLDHRALVSGFHPTETCGGVRRRWTDGHAELDIPRRTAPSVLELRVVDRMTAWQAPVSAAATSAAADRWRRSRTRR